MWLVEEYGVDKYKKSIIKEVESYDRGVKIEDTQLLPTGEFKRRSLLSIHKQPQEGKVRVDALVSSGRLIFKEAKTIADVADNYSLEFFNMSRRQSSFRFLVNTEMEPVTASKENEEIKEPCTPETVDIYRSASNCSNIENSLEI